MKTFTMPGTDLVVPAVVTGVMRIQEKSDTEVQALFDASLAAGINFFDHADIYGDGAAHGCEARFAEALQLTSAQRDEIVLQTKAGIVKDGPYFDFSYEHIIEAVDGSLAALRTDHIDILLLHRPDALVEPEEVARAFDELADAGKVRNFGVSNHTPAPDRAVEALRPPAAGCQPGAAVDHPRPAHRPGGCDEHGWPGAVDQPGPRHPRLLPAARHHAAGLVAVPGRVLHRRLPRQPRLPRAERRHRPARVPPTTCPWRRSPPPGSPGTRHSCRWFWAPPALSGSPLRRRAPTSC